MIRFNWVSIIGVCLLFSACSNPLTSDSDSSVSESSQTQQTDKSTSEKTSETIELTLNKAQSATEKTSKNIHSVLEKVNKTAQSASKVVEDIIAVKAQLKEMSTYAGNTLTAVHSGNFQAAQQEFTQLQGNWHQIKGTVKKNSPKVYQEVDNHLTTIDAMLKQPNPDPVKLANQLSLLSDKNFKLLKLYSQDRQ